MPMLKIDFPYKFQGWKSDGPYLVCNLKDVLDMYEAIILAHNQIEDLVLNDEKLTEQWWERVGIRLSSVRKKDSQ